MLKLVSASSCLQTRAQQALARSISPNCLRVAAETPSPLLRVLNSVPRLGRRSTFLGQRVFFCSDSAADGAEAEAVAPTEAKDAEAAENSSSAIVPTKPRPEDYLTVLALPLHHRPLFPGFYLPISVKDPKLLAALQESMKRQAPYAGAFLLKDEPDADPGLGSGSESEKSIDGLKGKELFSRLCEVGTLAQINDIRGEQVILVGHRRLRITEMVSDDPLTVKVDHLKDLPYDKDSKEVVALSSEVVATLQDVLIRNPSWRDHAQVYNRILSSSIGTIFFFFGLKSETRVATKPAFWRGKFLTPNILVGNKHCRSCSSQTLIDPSVLTELISKQHWSRLRTLLHNPTAVLQQLLDSAADSELTLRYFNWSQKDLSLTYPSELTCKLLNSLILEKSYSKARSFVDKFVNSGDEHSVSSIFHSVSSSSDSLCSKSIMVDMLILSFAKNMKTQLALEAFRRAGDYGLKLSALSCNPLLNNLVKEKAFADVESVYKEIIRRRVDYNVITFNTVINGLCKVGKLNKAIDVVEDMKASGISPNVITYNTLIDGYCKMGGPSRMYKADAVLKKMVGEGTSANEVTYNILIHGFCEDDNLNAALKLFDEMRKRDDLKPNVVTYNSLINGLCKNDDIKKAISLRDEMLSTGLKPNVVTYNALVNGMCRNKMLAEAKEMLDEMEEQGLIPSIITFNTLINAYCKNGMMDEAFSVHCSMLRRQILPNVSTYNTLIGGLCGESNIGRVRVLLQEMKGKGLKPDVVTYNVLMSSLCKLGNTKKALNILDDMLNCGLSPTHVTYNTLMDGYCKEGNLRAALKVREMMERGGKRANTVTYNVLIKGFCKKGKMEDANNLLNEMLEKGLVLNRTTFDIVKVEMVDKGFVPDIEGHLYNVS